MKTAVPPADSQHLRLPARTLYWAVLNNPGWTRTGPLPPGLLPVLEDDLPVPVDEVFAVGTPMDGSSLLVCACSRAVLTGLPPGTTGACPDLVPVELSGRSDPSALNLLVGEFEPVEERRGRTLRSLRTAGVLVLCAAMLAAGLWRRAEHARAQAAAVSEQTGALLRSTTSSESEDELVSKLALLSTLAEAVRRFEPGAGVDGTLAELLMLWPRSVEVTPQTIVLSKDAISIVVTTPHDPARFIGALRAPTGWRLDEPRLTAIGESTRVNIQFTRSPAPAGDSAAGRLP